MGAWLTSSNTLLPTCYGAVFVRFRSNGRSVISEIRLKMWPSRPACHGYSRSSEPIRTDQIAVNVP